MRTGWGSKRLAGSVEYPDSNSEIDDWRVEGCATTNHDNSGMNHSGHRRTRIYALMEDYLCTKYYRTRQLRRRM
jgi:hypothetical protein